MAGETLPAPLALVIQGRRGRVGILVGSLMLHRLLTGVKYFSHTAQLSYLQKVVTGKALPAPLALVI
jgi:hypothetical protein